MSTVRARACAKEHLRILARCVGAGPVRHSERGRTLSRQQVLKEVKAERKRLEEDVEGRRFLRLAEKTRPHTWGECQERGLGARPCPYVGCYYHLYADVLPTGSLKMLWSDADPLELPETCALAVAQRGGLTLDEVGLILNITRERVRQIQVDGLRRFLHNFKKLGLSAVEVRAFLGER